MKKLENTDLSYSGLVDAIQNNTKIGIDYLKLLSDGIEKTNKEISEIKKELSLTEDRLRQYKDAINRIVLYLHLKFPLQYTDKSCLTTIDVNCNVQKSELLD